MHCSMRVRTSSRAGHCATSILGSLALSMLLGLFFWRAMPSLDCVAVAPTWPAMVMIDNGDRTSDELPAGQDSSPGLPVVVAPEAVPPFHETLAVATVSWSLNHPDEAHARAPPVLPSV